MGRERFFPIATAIVVAALAVASVLVFLRFDRHSHSASDTLRPFLITMVPIWLAAIGGIRLALRPRQP